MLLAVLLLLHSKLRAQEGGARRRQVVENALLKLAEMFTSSLTGYVAPAEIASMQQSGSWGQVRGYF